MPVNSTPHFFVSGVFRSGTTFVARALNAHPELTVLSDPHRAFFKYFRNKFYESKVPDFDPSKPLADYYNANTDLLDEYHQEWWNLPVNQTELEEIRQAVVKGAYQFSPRIAENIGDLKGNTAAEVYDDLVRLGAIAYGHEKNDNTLIGTKEVWTDEYLDGLMERGRKCVQIIRDPRAVIASNRKSSTGSYPILFLIRQWRKSVAFHFANRDKQNYHWVTYENLVREPERRFGELLDFLGVDFHPAVVDPTGYKDGSGDAWKQNSSYGTSRKINTASLDKWKAVLRREEIPVIEWFCRAEMNYLGYERVADSMNFPTPENLVEEYPNMAGWIKKFNFDLTPQIYDEEADRYTMLAGEKSDDEALIRQRFIFPVAYENLRHAVIA